MEYRAKALATPNIAVIKYWGKRDEKLMLPANSSLSFTMDEQLKTITEIRFGEDVKKDGLVLDGKPLSGKEFGGAEKVLKYAREKYGIGESLRAKIISNNYFPTAAGMASSASGYAALAAAINEALQLHLNGRELSMLARLGSGSASRSVFGGFVEWKRGERADGTDSYAVQVADENCWKELRNVIAIVESGRKEISSRAGMRQTVKTSGLFSKRMGYIEDRVNQMKRAVLHRDFGEFAALAMKDSDDLHSMMADTEPPIFYLNGTSRKIMEKVRQLNGKDPIAAYTFDAGPNAHIFTTEENAGAVEGMLRKISGVRQVIVCKVGSGPRILE